MGSAQQSSAAFTPAHNPALAQQQAIAARGIATSSVTAARFQDAGKVEDGRSRLKSRQEKKDDERRALKTAHFNSVIQTQL